MRKISLLAAALLSFISTAAVAGEIDLDRWVSRPGVRVLVVDFYATWCGPCVEALPKWRALIDKHRGDGLRLVLVTTRDAKGCLAPPLPADELVCDESGRIADLFSANPLPAAYVWNGQGKLLGKRLGAAEVERQLEGWLNATPRVKVEVSSAPRGLSSNALRDLLRGELRASGKLEVVATAEEQTRLDKVKAESLKARYDEKAACEVGKELSANSILDARVADDRLSLSLFSAERGCLVASAAAPWNTKRPEAAVAEAIAALYARLAPEVELPWGDAAPEPIKGAAILSREPALLVIRAEGTVGAEVQDRLERLNLGKRSAKAAARDAALGALAGPPYNLDAAGAAAKIDAAEEEYSTNSAGAVVMTLRVRL